MPKSERGLFLVFEGLDRTGKSTQAKLLCEKMNFYGMPTELIRFPNRESPTGKILDSYLKKEITLEPHAAHLLFSANRWEMAAEMEAKLGAGINLVVDRYFYSGIAYSAANGLSFSWVKESDGGLPIPDILFFINAKGMLATDSGELFENAEFQKKVYRNFQKILAMYKKSVLRERLVVLHSNHKNFNIEKISDFVFGKVVGKMVKLNHFHLTKNFHCQFFYF